MRAACLPVATYVCSRLDISCLASVVRAMNDGRQICFLIYLNESPNWKQILSYICAESKNAPLSDGGSLNVLFKYKGLINVRK